MRRVTLIVAALVVGCYSDTSPQLPAFQIAGQPSSFQGGPRLSLGGRRHALLGRSLAPTSSEARFLGRQFGFSGVRRLPLCLSMQTDDGAEVDSAFAADQFVVLKKTAEIGVVQKVGDGKCEVLMPTKKTRKIKDKEMMKLHPGPMRSWELFEVIEAPKKATQAKIKEVFDYLAADEEVTDIEGLATLLFGEYKPNGAWAAWKLVEEDIYFHGTPEAIQAYSQDRVKALMADQKRTAKEQKEREEFLQRIKDRALTDEDHDKRLGELVDFAMGKIPGCSLLKEMGVEQRADDAHRLLLELEHWDETVNPWPTRCRVNLAKHSVDAPPAAKEERRDMTSMGAYAIDLAGTKDPDDAISVAPDGKFWVHIADVASRVQTDTPTDIEARSRGASVYLPEGAISMLPKKVTEDLALGLKATSPALSFGFRLGEGGKLEELELCKSTVKAQMMTYEAVHDSIEAGDEPFKSMYAAAMQFRARREADGAVGFQFPEAEVTVRDRGEEVNIVELPLLSSKELVMEFMLMAGEAAAMYALENKIPFLFASQPVPAVEPPKGKKAKTIDAAAAALARPSDAEKVSGPPRTLSDMFKAMKSFERSSIKTAPALHYSLGMSSYSQVTSPLRRYADLVAHQQLRMHLEGKKLLTEEQLVERVKAAEEVTGLNKKAERMSKQHWTLVWMSRCEQPWEGLGTCIDVRQNRPGGARVATVIIQELGFMCQVKLKKDVKLDADVSLQLHAVRFPELRADLVQFVPPVVLFGSEEAETFKKNLRARKNVGTRLAVSEKRGGG